MHYASQHSRRFFKLFQEQPGFDRIGTREWPLDPPLDPTLDPGPAPAGPSYTPIWFPCFSACNLGFPLGACSLLHLGTFIGLIAEKHATPPSPATRAGQVSASVRWKRRAQQICSRCMRNFPLASQFLRARIQLVGPNWPERPSCPMFPLSQSLGLGGTPRLLLVCWLHAIWNECSCTWLTWKRFPSCV